MPTFIILLIFYIIIAYNYNNIYGFNGNNTFNVITNDVTISVNQQSNLNSHHFNDTRHRMKRGIFWDFLQKVFITKNLIVDQYQDATNTLNDVYNILNQQFSDTATEITMLPTTRSLNENLIENESTIMRTTTTEKPKLSRYDFGRILGRNYRGLKRLLDIEISDALNQSQSNVNEYRREADRQFANSLPLEKRKLIKSYIG